MSVDEEVITPNDVVMMTNDQIDSGIQNLSLNSFYRVVKREGGGFVCCHGDGGGGVVSWAGGRGPILFKAESENWSIAAKQPK